MASTKTQDLDYNDREQALEIIKRFKKKYLHDNIEELKDFSFWYILTDEEFNGVSFDGTIFDGDRTRIVYAIDKLLYDKKEIPDFKLGPGGNYTGDTINTFRTLFGNRFIIQDGKNGEEQVEEKFYFDEKLKKDKNIFFWTYQTIGNFYILPTVSGKSINKLRGTNRWKDYFDIFIENLDLCLKDSEEKDKTLDSYLHEDIYRNFFKKFKFEDDSFLRLFYLSKYKNFKYPHPNKDVLCGHNNYSNKYISEKEYVDFAFYYIQKATELINDRSMQIVNFLKDIKELR